MKRLLCAVVMVLAAAVAAAHNGESPPPVAPAPIGSGLGSGGMKGRVGGGQTSRNAKPGSTSAASVKTWWSANREIVLDLKSRRRAARAAQRGPATPETGAEFHAQRDPLARERGLSALRDAATHSSVHLASSAVVALGKARDLGSWPVLVRLACDDNTDQSVRQSACLSIGILAASYSDANVFIRAALRDGVRREEERGFGALGAALGGSKDLLPLLARTSRQRESRRDVPAIALLSLGITGDEIALPDLVTVAAGAVSERDPDWVFRAVGAAAIGKIGSRAALPALMRALSDEEVGVRRQAAMSLGLLLAPGDEEALQAIAGYLLRERDATARGYAAITLGECGWPRAEDLLFRLLADGDAMESSYAAVALALLVRSSADAALAERVRASLRREFEDTDRAEHRQSVAIALGISGDKASAPALRRLFTGPLDPETKSALALGLGLLGDLSARPLLLKALSENGSLQMRENVAQALGLLGDADSIRVLSEILRSQGTDYFRGGSARALGYLVEPEESGPLIDVLANPRESDIVRAMCAMSLGRVLDPEPVPFFSRLTSHMDPLLPVETLRLAIALF